ncbi:MAG: tryptophan synthase subunit alpha [Bacteroidales bacterium]|nr:MAG: tryptophan synthase subunit alpha [Bacteroidales bacterium]
MNRIEKLFKNKPGNILSVYFTAGYPALNDTKTIINALADNGADIIEIGMPFSDPLADGPVIQKSNDIALKNGMNIKLLFKQLENIREETDIPLLLMGYLNPVMQYGIREFCIKAEETGIDGLILPDLPAYIYLKEFKELFEKHNLSIVFLVAPETSDARVREIDRISNGFIYIVSSSSTTGVKEDIESIQIDYFKRIENLHLRNPRLIGFGISNNKTFKRACEFGNGAIIGSAFIKVLENPDMDLEEKIKNFITAIK